MPDQDLTPIDYEGPDPAIEEKRRVRANRALALVGVGFAVMTLHFLFVTTVSHHLQLQGRPVSETTHVGVYVASVVVEFGLAVAAMVLAAGAVRFRGPALDRPGLAMLLALLLLYLTTCCGGMLWMGDLS